MLDRAHKSTPTSTSHFTLQYPLSLNSAPTFYSPSSFPSMARAKASSAQTKPKATKAAGSKKSAAAAKTDSSHPSWIDMIKASCCECIIANHDDARIGVSRPQIKKCAMQFLQYGMMTNAVQGPSGRVKLTPKAKAADVAAAKESKPAVQPKAAPKPKTAVAPKKSAPVKKSAVKSTTKPTTSRTSTSKAKTAVKAKPAIKPAPAKKATTTKKATATKAKPAPKKTTTPSKRGSAKKAVTGTSAAANAKAAKGAATKKAAAKKPAAKGSSSKSTGTKKQTNKRSPYPCSHIFTAMSARITYPKFIPFHENLLLQVSWALKGLYDSFRINILFSTITSDAEIRANLFKSLLLNSLSVTSIYTYDILLHPLVKDQEKWLHRNLGRFYQVLWLLPVIGISFYLNMSWCSVIAKRTYILHYGSRAVAQPPRTYSNFLNQLATSAYRAVMIFTSVIVSWGLKKIPFVGSGLEFTFLCWVDSSVWINRGFSFSGRIRHLEERWAYYFAFGFPSAVICMLGTGLASFTLFALVFPLYIILATHARPAPINPFNPTSTTDNDVIRHPTPFIPIRLRVFAPVVFLNDLVAKFLDTVVPATKSSHVSRHRVSSDPSENVEEGIGIELNTLKDAAQPIRPTRPAQSRINIGTRRKLD
ncbi:hypothetical protein D9756_001931 [Leucocoprinus leucothites]|uniref:Uncharacterized protein n=1 Tax=Leucocoprinus leucothites TaxID=201217 RepID=A0A8H5G4F1_9AGAR|nr:hypothetical protein D9756_001931 [Leucoagaricus leucothites]